MSGGDNSPAGHRATVLVVDDDDALRPVVQRALEAANFHVLSTNSPARALAMIDAQPVTVILTDLSMPEMDGWEFCSLVHRRRPEVILGIMTGWGEPADERALAASGVCFILSKPFNLRELQATVRAAVNR